MPFITTYAPTRVAVAEKLLEIEAIKLNDKTPFIWSSGWKSPIYCDNRLTLSFPSLRTYIKEALVAAIRHHWEDAELIAGVATAGIPQGALVADALNLPYVYVRPKPKEHGMGNQIEGKVEKGKKVILVEDLISTGGSSLKAAEALQAAGFMVLGMVAIFTYGFEVAEQNFAQAKIPVVCLSDFHHLLPVAVQKKYLNEGQLAHIKTWRQDPARWQPI